MFGQTVESPFELKKYQFELTEMAISPDSKFVAISCSYGKIHIILTREILLKRDYAVLKNHDNQVPIKDMKFVKHEKNLLLISTSYDRTLVVVEMQHASKVFKTKL